MFARARLPLWALAGAIASAAPNTVTTASNTGFNKYCMVPSCFMMIQDDRYLQLCILWFREPD
jgi:hypothetical protein